MTTPHSMESMMTRKFGWIAMVLLTATVSACGGSTQTTGTAPSLVAPVAASTETAGTLGLLKEGNGKGHLGTPRQSLNLATPTPRKKPETSGRAMVMAKPRFSSKASPT